MCKQYWIHLLRGGWCWSLCCAAACMLSAQRDDNFSPLQEAPAIPAVRAIAKINLDGVHDEADWQRAPLIRDFFRMEPLQGGTPHFRTEVRILYDDKHLYFGVFCQDSLGKKGVRVQDFRRDFRFGENDIFYLQLDPQNLRRYCTSFQTTPIGTQRDLQAFDDDIRDNDWDALWRVKTRIAPEGWYAEFAIPFKSLRYELPAGDSLASWGFTLARLARREYEQVVFPPVPQAYSPYRMAYAAQLTGLDLPKPSLNIRFQPYGLAQREQRSVGGSAVDSGNGGDLKIGGDAKWAINPHAVLDMTFNTDFAQADVDRAVNNLTRFNLFFPERRQFFLENSGIYPGDDDIRPYFSRTIGLANSQFDATPAPIDAGLRFNDRNENRTWSGMYVNQRGTEQQGRGHFALMRYQKNLGKLSNIGGMITHRYDQPTDALGDRHNTTVTMDGFWRPNNEITASGFLSISQDAGRTGNAGNVFVAQNNNKFYWGWLSKWASEQYMPGMGFVFQNNVMYHNPGAYYIWRPKKEKALIRRADPGVFINYYHDAWSGKFQQANLYLFPIYIYFRNNSFLQVATYPTWQRIDFDFAPLNIGIGQRDYYYTRYQFTYNSDASKRVSLTSQLETGGFYDGQLTTLNAGLRLAPIPHIALTVDYEYNAARSLGISSRNVDVQLWAANLRLALNPRLQAQVFYQFNDLDRRGRWNARFSWEYQPLSFLYVVFNDTRARLPVNGDTVTRTTGLIGKLSWMRQI